MISYDEALDLLVAEAGKITLSTQPVSLQDSVGRVLAQDITTNEFHPPWDCSAMDGFAFSFAEVTAAGASPVFSIEGVIAAGDTPLSAAQCHGVWEIMTGAPLPAHCDTVIRVEDCEVQSKQVRFLALPSQGRNVRRRGEDFAPGRPVVRRGHQLRPQDLLCLATLGITDVQVYRRLQVGLVATGRELVDIGAALQPGQVRSSSSLLLQVALEKLGVEVCLSTRTGDDPEELIAVLREARLRGLDLVISTGAISMGKFDFVGSCLESQAATMHFRKVQVRPARPILFATLPGGDKPLRFLGLPGQPVSTLVGLQFFFTPFLKALYGQEPFVGVRLPLARATKKPAGVTSFLRAKIVPSALQTLASSAPQTLAPEAQQTLAPEAQQTTVEVHEQQQPSMLSPLLECEAWVKLVGEAETFAAGDMVECFLPQYFII